MAPARRPTPAQMRERRARIAAIALGVVFLGVAGFEGPKLYKTISGKSNAVSLEVSAATSTTAVAAATFTQAGGPGTPPGQLQRFTLLAVKDPFRPQPQETTTTTCSCTSTSGSGDSGTSTSAETTTTSDQAATPPPPPPVALVTFGNTPTTTTTSTATSTTDTGTAGQQVAATVPAGVVQMNGHRLVIQIGGGFPLKTPIFRVVELRKGGLQLKLVGGSFSDGTRTVELHKGRPVILFDSTDGNRFAIRFVKFALVTPDAVTNPAPLPPSTTTTTPATPAG
jgi:hypothetical protein